MRADQLILQRGLVPTRSAAQRLIERNAVRWLGPKGWAVVNKAGLDVPEDCEMEITDDAELRFVSRGGLKLEGALKHCSIDVTGMSCLDLGQSTGGFTDALLQSGAAKVVGLDVGHGQLHPKLAGDARVTSYEGINARDVAGSAFAAAHAEHSFDFVTADLSFITSTHVLPTMVTYLKPGGHLLLLVKPQFELQPAQIGKGGIVKDPAHFVEVENRLWQACKAQGLKVQQYFQSPIQGGNGNTEFFVWAKQPA
ncbi:TlyA family RNA methyltransferase [Piscinibacter sp. HJYY11]|uniref:TlyA family RNA methyltransferase n=1 Tax=Piscinibacter sp. HJYY11 TaxID=2801333 RepID=UPI00191E247C|nr:TlyA family RNA methyltransferase [Piscinibacter sp. HJYY11]MBL0729855.1 TlyA family RNA methyltransferase [Piscinibacter sp. HJYY11]